MIEDRLRAVRLDEPRLDLDVDELVAHAARLRRRRRTVLAAAAASCVVAIAAMTVGLAAERGEPGHRHAAAPRVTVTTPRATPSLPAGVCLDTVAGLPEVVAGHIPKARLKQVRSSCRETTFLLVGTSGYLTVGIGDAVVPAEDAGPIDDLAGPGGSRLYVYQGRNRHELSVLLVSPDGTMVGVRTVGSAVVDLDALIALVTDPVLPR